MAGTDRFANIASEAPHMLSKNELAPIEPISFDKSYFAKSDKKAESIEEKTYKEKTEQFKKDLCKLKKKLSRFLNDYSPKKSIVRKKTELVNFQFRYEQKEDLRNFNRILNGEGTFENITLPDYKGPVGRWTGFYRTEFKYEKPSDKRVFIKFMGVDYTAKIYLNNRFIGAHTGFFCTI